MNMCSVTAPMCGIILWYYTKGGEKMTVNQAVSVLDEECVIIIVNGEEKRTYNKKKPGLFEAVIGSYAVKEIRSINDNHVEIELLTAPVTD